MRLPTLPPYKGGNLPPPPRPPAPMIPRIPTRGPLFPGGKGRQMPSFKSPKATPRYAQEAIDYGSLEADQGTKWTDGKGIYRKTIDVGALANTGSTTTAHTISKLGKVLRVYGYATDATNYYSLPYASPTAVDNIAVAIDATNITITTGKDRTGNTGYITLEYTKS